MQTTPFRLIAPLVFATMMTACATSAPPSVDPPRLTLPAAATTPCSLPRLPEAPTVSDLEAVYAQRGAAIVLCEGARSLSVQTLLAERALQDRWREETKPKPWWRTLLPG